MHCGDEPLCRMQSVSAFRWTSDAKHLYVGSNDHNLRIFGLGAEGEAA